MNKKTILVVGASGGIGRAVCQHLLQNHVATVYATYHHQCIEPADFVELTSTQQANLRPLNLDISDDDSIAAACEQIKQHSGHLDWVINCAGVLHQHDHYPEKALKHIQSTFFLHNMHINALGSLLLAKHCQPLLRSADRQPKQPAVFAVISARVGSITDNRLGGWYSYRMSKAALNMGLKTLSIEWQRSLPNTCVVALQPGTVDTPLSAPYQSNVPNGQLFAPSHSAQSLLHVLTTLDAQNSGCFLDWDNQPIPW